MYAKNQSALMYKNGVISLKRRIALLLLSTVLVFLLVCAGVFSAKAKRNTQSEVGSVKFAVIGDYGYAGRDEQDVANLVKSWNPDFIITLGDNNYDNGEARTIDANIGQYYHEYIGNYTGSYGAGSAVNRFFPSLGNHDWYTSDAQPYLDYFTLPNNERYYDYVQGVVHFFVLDSYSYEVDGVTPTSIQGIWLKNKLAASTSTWNAVYFHDAPYSSCSDHGSNVGMQWPFKAWGADVVLSGHDHVYERIIVDGLTYFVNGAGGDGLYPFGPPVVGSQVRYSDNYGAMLVNADESSMVFKFITRSGTIVDTYSLLSPYTPSPTVTTPTFSATPTQTNTSTATFTNTPTNTATYTATNTPTYTATNTSTATQTNTPTYTATNTLTYTSTSTSTSTRTPTHTLTSTLTPTSTQTNTSTPTYTPTSSSVVTVISSVRDMNTSDSSTVRFIVTFSEPVIGVDVTDFTLTTSGVSGATVIGVDGTGSIYTVSVNTGSGNGTIRLNVMDDDTIKDKSLNPLGGLGMGNGDFTYGDIYTIIKSATFTDVTLTYWANSYIERLSNAGITGGCGAGIYCPDSTVTRAQMAVFLLKSMHGSNYIPPSINGDTGFLDVTADYWAAAWIKQLAAEGITGGCGMGIYCPDLTVTRAQMAIFLLKAKHGSSYIPPDATGVFTDVPLGYWADKWVEQLYSEGVTTGCAIGSYCPDASVTRAQMAVFLVKTFGLP